MVFAGSRTGTLTSAGDRNRLVGHVGTRIKIVADGIANSFAPFGAQIGTRRCPRLECEQSPPSSTACRRLDRGLRHAGPQHTGVPALESRPRKDAAV